jgi:hypothetical protein
MTNSFATTWKEIQYYLDNQISIIPVRDKPQTWNNREYPVKSAYPWKEFQKRIATHGELHHAMSERYDTLGYGIVCGAVSGNLEAIDIDVKNWAGIDARLFTDIRSLLPHIWEQLRIHRSPSGGYHIIYRHTGTPSGNQKLAYRADAKEAAIETRGEGGYIAAGSAMGYQVTHDRPIPTLTAEERASLIAICEGYNERRTIKHTPISRQQSDYYDTDPWTHFNGSPSAETVLTDAGWTICGQNNHFIWFTRPGKSSGVSASFNHDRRVYYIFTSSAAPLEPSRGYQPATLLSILQHNGDRKQTYAWLTSNGYGKVKPKIEQERATKLARAGKPIPANFSETATQLAVSTRGTLEALHPHGTFWEYDEDNATQINIELLLRVASAIGFRYHNKQLVHIDRQLVHKVDTRYFQDTLKQYIHEPDPTEYTAICAAYELFMKRTGDYTMTRIAMLDTSQILCDTANTCHKFYQNGYLTIDATSITFCEYDTLSDKLIWADKVQPRNYNRGAGGRYEQFLQHAIDTDLTHTRRVLGYLAHDYKDSATPYIIVLTEACENPKDGGGSGKNLFCTLLKYTTTFHNKPGDQFKPDEKAFQSWTGQRIFCISDAPKSFNFLFLKEPSSGSFIYKRLHKDEVTIEPADGPKFIIQTNYSYEVTDGGLRRRIIPIEFTDFFTRAGGVDAHFGMLFPDGWTVEDWAGYDNLIAESVQDWLKANRRISAPTLTDGGWLKQFEQTYGAVIHGLIEEYWDSWLIRVQVPNSQFKIELERYYNENGILKQYQPSSRKINEAIGAWARKHGIEYSTDINMRVGAITEKHRVWNPF